MEMLEYAIKAHEAGLCVVPPKGDGSKAPLGTWRDFQDTRSSVEQIRAWYADANRTGIGAVLGKTSGLVELLEFDDPLTYAAYKKLALAAKLDDLVDRIEAGYLETTPNGVHWLYRCEVVEGNTKLAQRLKSDEEREHPHDNVKTLIETRGEGGYVVLAPSHGNVHPSGEPYTLKSGGYGTIAEITPIERERLFSLARSFDAMPRQEAAPAPRTITEPAGDEERPGDYYNRTRTWSDVLAPHGWREQFTHGVETYWTRPGRDKVTSATTNYADSDLLKVFSTSTQFDTGRTYSKFGAYALLNFGGSFAEAARTIRKEMPRVERTKPSTANSLLMGHDLLADTPMTGPMVTGEAGEAMTTVFSAPSAYERLLARVFTTDQLFDLPPPEWLVKPILTTNSLAVVWGQSATYKSFFALDIALCVATGQWWKGREVVKPGIVFYVAAEGAAGIPKRVRAWSEANNLKQLDRMRWLPESVNILDDDAFDALRTIIAEVKPDLLVIDTLARSMAGGEENGAKDMGLMIDRADELKRLSEGTVLLIHHSTKEGATARGSGALRAAVDTEIEMKREGTTTIAFCRKQKDDAEFDPITLHLVTVDDSCVLSLVSQSGETSDASSQARETARRLYRETFGETGVAGAELRTAFIEQLPTSRASAYRLINDLVHEGFIRNRATPARPFYEAGENYDGERSSQRLSVVSERLTGQAQTSHTPRGSIDPEGETAPEMKREIERGELW